jgi:hypothetical protein
VSEIFPLEVRALAIAFFYAIGTAIGGIAGPLVFERLASTGDPSQVMIGYLVGAAVMAFGGIMELLLGVPAEQKQLEDIAKPLTAEEAEREEAEPQDAARRREELERRRRTRQERDRAGLRRFRLGPGSASFSPFIAQPADEAWLDEQIGIIQRALGEHGALPRSELAHRVGARYWGPGVFRRALREAVLEEIVRRVGRDRYELATDGAPDGGNGKPVGDTSSTTT